MAGFLRDLAAGLGDLFFPHPESCAICDRAARPKVGLCADCLSRLPFLTPPLCERCGRLLRNEAANRKICAECERERLFFTRARAVCLYEGPARAYLHEVKFRRSLSLARALAGLLAVYVREERDLFRDYQVIIPVPLHSRREEERGFNQAEVMAYAVGEALRRPVLTGVLVRTKQTEAQSRLDREARRENVRGAFRVTLPSSLAGRKALLVDDIMTTGYTASECARVMLRAGTLEIGVLTLANGSLDEEWLTGEKSAKKPGRGDRCLNLGGSPLQKN